MTFTPPAAIQPSPTGAAIPGANAVPNNRAPTTGIPPGLAALNHLRAHPVGPGHPIFDDEYQTWRRLDAPHEEAKGEAMKSTTEILREAAALQRWLDAHPEQLGMAAQPSSAEAAFTDPPDTEPPPPEQAYRDLAEKHPSTIRSTHAERALAHPERVASLSSSEALESARLMFLEEPPGGDWTNQAQASALLAARVDPSELSDYQLAHPPPFLGGPLFQRYVTEALEGMIDDPNEPGEHIQQKAHDEAAERIRAAVQSFDWKAWFGFRQTAIDGALDPVAAPPAKKKRGRPPKNPAPAQAATASTKPKKEKGAISPPPIPAAPPLPLERLKTTAGETLAVETDAQGNPTAVLVDGKPATFTVAELSARAAVAAAASEGAAMGLQGTEETEDQVRAKARNDHARRLMGVASEMAELLETVVPWQRLAVLEVMQADVAGRDAARRLDNMLGSRTAEHPFEEKGRYGFDTDEAVLRLRDEIEELAYRAKRIQGGRFER